MAERNFIEVHGAREKNLKNVSLNIPKQKLTVFTGVSGSGKSSLVFDTIAAEAQRQLNETFTYFVQGDLPNYGQPDIDRITSEHAYRDRSETGRRRRALDRGQLYGHRHAAPPPVLARGPAEECAESITGRFI
jgi:excinuclease UvrABC ATPase subunit